MNNRNSRITVSVVTILALLLGVFAACSPSPNASSGPSPASVPDSPSVADSSAETPSGGNVNIFGWEVPAEPITITMMDASGNYAPLESEAAGLKNNIDYLRENFNVHLTVETITGDGNEALNLALASGTYPEVIYNINRDYVSRFVSQGRVVELTPYLDTLAKDIKTSMGDMYPLFLDSENKLWSFPIGMGALYELPDYSAHIRYDEWLAIGEPEIKTPDDYYNALDAILKKFPTTPNGESRYAMSLYELTNPSQGFGYPELFSGYWGLKKGFKISDNNAFTYWAFTDEGKEMTKFFNRFHLDGTLDPDAFANKHADWKEKFSNERIVGAMGGWWISYNAGHEVWLNVDPNSPEDKRFIQVAFKAPEAEAAYITPKNEVPSRNTIITDKAENIEGIIKYINFQATELGSAYVGWGIPNGTPIGDTDRTVKAWNLHDDGTWEIDPAAKEALIAETWNYNEASYEEFSPALFQNYSRWDDGEHCVWLNQMWYNENKWKTIMMNNMEGTIYNATSMTLLEKSDELMQMETAIRDAWTQGWPLAVLANSDAEFDSAWSMLQNALEAAGIHEYEKIAAENYAANEAKLG